MKRTIICSLSIAWLAAFIVSAALNAEDNWPHWRGPQLNGSSDSTGLPSEWSLEKNVVWKTELPAWSGSTPIIWGDRIFVMSPSKPADGGASAEDQPRRDGARGNDQQRTERGGQRGGGRGARGGRRGGRRGFGPMRGPATAGGKEILLFCLSKTDGSVLWQAELENKNRKWGKQNSSSPSPVTDGQHVWTLTGNGQLSCLDFDGNQKWSLNLQEKYGQFGLGWGYASSPLLLKDKLIVQVLHGQNTDDPSYIVAFDAASGKQLWKQERPTDAPAESPDAYTTPMVVQHDGQTQIVISGGDYVTGHDPDTGNEIWRSAGLNPEKRGNYRVVGTPLVTENLIIAPTRRRPLLAIRPGGEGDITDSHIAWQFTEQGGPDVPSPLSDGQRLYLVEDRGAVTCLDLKTGEIIWGPERTEMGTVSASPLLADGKIYITNEKCVTSVIKTGDQFERIATNKLDDSYTLSSIAVSGSQLFIRTTNGLYCIGQ